LSKMRKVIDLVFLMFGCFIVGLLLDIQYKMSHSLPDLIASTIFYLLTFVTLLEILIILYKERKEIKEAKTE